MNSMKRMMSGEFNFNDFLGQMRMMQRLGPLEGLLKLLPGFGKLRKQLPEGALDPKRMKRMEAIVLSMTPAERANYKLLIPSRRRRIAKGSGVPEIEVNRFIKNFKEMKEMMGGKGKMGNLMKAMGSMQGGAMPGGMPPMPPTGAAGMPDINEMMKSGNLPDLSSMFGPGADMSALGGGAQGRKNKAPMGAGNFLGGLFRRKR